MDAASRPADVPRAAEALVQHVLAEYGALTRERLADYLPQGEPGDYLYELLSDYPRRGGKMLRPCLCIATARAFGASVDAAIDSAVSVELLHNAMLIHDDIEDDSDQRRGTPTLHELHGVPLALNAGDALTLLSVRPLKNNLRRFGASLAGRMFEETERMAWESAEGQALELGWRRDNRLDVDENDYLLMVLKKTCWLMAIHPMRLGCLIGGRGQVELDPFIRFGFFFGAAFQIQDDLLNLDGDAAYGKELCGDLLEGKRTLMLIHAFRHAATADRRRLLQFLGKARADRGEADVRWLRALIDRSGAMAHARAVAHALAGAALYEFEQVFAEVPDSRDKQFIGALATWVLQRVH